MRYISTQTAEYIAKADVPEIINSRCMIEFKFGKTKIIIYMPDLRKSTYTYLGWGGELMLRVNNQTLIWFEYSSHYTTRLGLGDP